MKGIKLRVNSEIDAKAVRLVGENVTPRICSISEALKEAEEKGLDLVEFNRDLHPICKILDYQKYCYEQKKKEKENKKKSASVELKEMGFTPNIGTHDYEFKKNQIQTFLEKGCKVKTFVFFKGRSITYSEQGKELLLKLAVDLENYGVPETMPVLEGKKMIMNINPIKKK